MNHVCGNGECAEPAIGEGPFCKDHGCGLCGGVMLADTEDWAVHLCFEHYETLQKLGGGGPDRYAPQPVEQPKEAPPKRYPPLATKPGVPRAVLPSSECQHQSMRLEAPETLDWPEPLCHECYAAAFARPPRAVLTFFDGTREMRRNPIVGKIYRDVAEEHGEPVVRWFERVHDQEDNGKPVMSFWQEIPRPVTSLGKPIVAAVPVKARPSLVRRFIRWVRVWFALRGIA